MQPCVVLYSIYYAVFSPGMEIASYMLDKASSITVIGSSEMPYQNTLGPEIGKMTMMVSGRKNTAGL